MKNFSGFNFFLFHIMGHTSAQTTCKDTGLQRLR